MNRPILIVVLGYIIGIIIGLYCKISIAFFSLVVYLILFLIKKYIIHNKNLKRYYNLLINKKLIMIFAISTFISNSIVLYLNHYYEQVYKQETKEVFTATVISAPVKKEYYTRYKIKIKSSSKNELKNATVFLNLKSSMELEYGEIISFLGEYKSPEVRKKL